MPKSFSGFFLKVQSEENCYPVSDCPNCKAIDVPFVIYPIPGPNNIYSSVISCLNCHQEVPQLRAKGFVSLIDLEAKEWDREL
ncbi:MAG: hypothetical protein PHU70_00525 [Dehalococcoidia bacterium]|nr:hypothetical protein [Dehalococcoidia bacterium]